ncbi:MAG: Co2+/Mg2+ efflux protein ApaG [Bacteroidetes bacterium]|nr:Co2+/Mg2+ efflux protein ApaG [Bacteroidota bacterium]
MVSKISEGVEISVEVFYQENLGSMMQKEFTFAYRISIENLNNFPIRLLRRHWFIFDSNGEQSEVEGEGVIGEQPFIDPGQKYQYMSGCNLKTEMGKMYGQYLMENTDNQATFYVNIPPFEMIVPFKNN